MRPRRRVLAVASFAAAVIVWWSSSARADGWGIGLQIGLYGRPHGNLGLPLDDIAGIPFDAPTEIVIRHELAPRTALNAGAGLPHDALGLTGWVGFELFQPVVESAHRICALEVYADPGVQLGYAGPDYFARHSGVFVGYEYGGTGPLSMAVRTPIGVRVRWPRVRLDTFVEVAPIVTFTPAVETFVVFLAGMRFRF